MTLTGARPTYSVPLEASYFDHLSWKILTVLQETVTLSEKLNQILEWIDLPLDERPQFISGLLFPLSSESTELTHSSSL